MKQSVYGIKISLDGCGVNADSILEMSNEEKQQLIDKYGVEDEVYTLESFLYYLNADMIDTENYFWILM